MLRNTEMRYGGVAKWLHWLTAFLVLTAYLLVLYLPESMPRWQAHASRASHFSLYALLIAMPISGYLGNGGGVSFGIFAIPGFGKTAIGQWVLNLVGMTFEEWEVYFDAFHYQIVGPCVLWVIIAAHAGAAIYHHYVEKDDVLKRMLPESS